MDTLYHDLEVKKKARARNVKVFQRLTGLQTIPESSEYWTLCASQPPKDGKSSSEIVQLIKSNFLVPDQFHGVDRNKGLIQQNKKWHPKAHWHDGEWSDVIRDHDFNPAMVYLDTISFINTSGTADLVANTMPLCPPNTVMIVNAMMNDPRSRKRFNYKDLVELICKRAGSFELNKWRRKVECFDYNATGYTNMMSLVLFKDNVDGSQSL